MSTYKTYKANHQFFLGEFDKYIHEGELIDFDGVHLKMGDKVISYAKFNAVIKQNWVTEVQGQGEPEESQVKEVPKKKKRTVTAANSGNPKEKSKRTELYQTSEDQRAVKKFSDKKSPEVDLNAEARVQNPENIGNFRLDAPDSPKRKMKIVQESEERETVGSLKSSAKRNSMDVVSGNSNDGTPVKTRKLKTASKFERTTIDGTESKYQEPSGEFVPQQNAENVAKISPEKLSQKMARKNAGKKPEFNWDLKMHYKKRIKKAVEEFGDDVGSLKAIFAVEKPNIVTMIKKKLDPQVLENFYAE